MSAHFFAITARLDAFDHDLGRLPLARGRTVVACVGTRLMGVLRHRAAASHQSSSQRAERLAVDRRFVGFGVVVGVWTSLLNFVQAMMGSLVTHLGTFVHNLDVFVVLMPFMRGVSAAAGQG